LTKSLFHLDAETSSSKQTPVVIIAIINSKGPEQGFFPQLSLYQCINVKSLIWDIA
jgi:hypothetical protein